MRFALILVLLSGCLVTSTSGDPAGLDLDYGYTFDCVAVFECSGVELEVGPVTTCADTADEAHDATYEELLELIDGCPYRWGKTKCLPRTNSIGLEELCL
jgi:hypothetical protein